MKLAFCLFKYFPYGGLQRDFIRIAKECIRRGHSVDVYTMQWEGEKEPTFSITMLPGLGLQNHTRIRHYIHQTQAYLSNYDLVIGFNKMPHLDVYFAADVCFKAKAYQQKSFWYRCTPRYKHFAEFEKAVFDPNSQTQVLTLTEQQQREFMKYYQTPEERFHLLPPGISKDRLAPDNAEKIRNLLRSTYHIQANEFLLLMVGSGFKTKGLDRVLLGLASLPENLKHRSRLLVLGKDRIAAFQRQATKLGIADKVNFLGGRDDVSQFMLAADLLLHPAYNESAGMVLLEALAAGLPVLTTDNCGYAHFVAEANGGVVLPSPFQQPIFNQTLQNMLLSPQLPLWRNNAYAFAKNANIYHLSEHAVNIIESLGQ